MIMPANCWDGPLTASGERLARVSAGGNHLYSVAAITDASGAVARRYAYGAYGQQEVEVDSAPAGMEQAYGFTGRRLDGETGLWYFRSRFFDSFLGRFISRDSIGLVDGVNLYAAWFIPGNLDPGGNKIETDCPIDKYLDEHLSGYSWLGPDPYSYYESAYTIDGSTGEILGAMIESSYVFVISGSTCEDEIDSLKSHVSARENIIAAAKSNNNVLGHGVATMGQFVNSFSGNMRERLNQANESCMRTGCQVSVGIMILTGIANSGIVVGDPVKDLLIIWEEENNNGGGSGRVVIPGDQVYFDNLSNAPAQFYEGENLVYIGGNEYLGTYGEGGTTRTKEEWLNEVGTWNDNAGAEFLDRRTSTDAGLEE